MRVPGTITKKFNLLIQMIRMVLFFWKRTQEQKWYSIGYSAVSKKIRPERDQHIESL